MGGAPPGTPDWAIWAPSPNHGARRGGRAVDMVVIHYTAMATAEAARARLSDPAAQVSAHYLIGRDGALWALVAEDRRAWHAGLAAWAGECDVNSRSIGIELDHPGEDEAGLAVPYPAAQVAALEALLADLRARRAVPPERVLGHACVAPGRKRDPGPAFDWRRLGRAGLAAWLDPPRADTTPGDVGAFRAAAASLGAPLATHGAWDADAAAVWSALAARFLPAMAHRARPPAAAVAHLARLAARYPGQP